MKRFSRTATLALVAVLLIAILAACGENGTATQSAATATKAPAGTTAAASTTTAPPATQGPPDEISYWFALPTDKVTPIYSDYADAPVTQWVMEATNTIIKFEHPPAGQEAEKFGLMLAAMEMTDIIERDFTSTANYPGGADKAIEDGIIIALNDSIDQGKFPNLMSYFDKHPDWIKHWISDSGNYVCVPFIREDPLLWTSWGPQVRLDWLEELNIGFSQDNLPNTIQDWDTVLRAFKANGKAEYPLLIVSLDSWGDNGSLPGAYGVGWEWYRDEAGQLQYGPMQDAFRDFLTQMATWNKDGLVDPDWEAKVNTEQLRSKILSNQAGMYFTNLGGGIGYLYDTFNSSTGATTVPEHPVGFRTYAVPEPTLEEGVKSRFGGSALPVANMLDFVSTNAKNLDAVCRFLDFGFGEEGDIMYNFGKEGLNFDYINYADFECPIDLSSFGDKFPRWNDTVYKAADGQPLAISLSRYVRSHFSGPMAQDVGYIVQFLPYFDQLASLDVWVNSSDFTGQLLPRMYFTTEESQKLADVEKDMKTYKDETVTQFLNGSLEINDANWTTFQDRLKQMGVETVLQIRRDAFTRASNR